MTRVTEPDYAVMLLLYLATDTLRIQSWSQDRRNQVKSNREHVRRKKRMEKLDIRKRTTIKKEV